MSCCAQSCSRCVVVTTTACTCWSHDELTIKRVQTVTHIGRRPVEYDGPGKEAFVQRLVDFDDPDRERFEQAFKGHDVGFCALGTTRGKAGAVRARARTPHVATNSNTAVATCSWDL